MNYKKLRLDLKIGLKLKLNVKVTIIYKIKFQKIYLNTF